MIMCVDARSTEDSTGIQLALCFAILHDTPVLHLNGSVPKRQNELYMSGKIHLTPLTVGKRAGDV
jgi:hypothetical protein